MNNSSSNTAQNDDTFESQLISNNFKNKNISNIFILMFNIRWSKRLSSKTTFKKKKL